MTRAKRHLVLVGYAKLDEPAKTGVDSRPFDWLRTKWSLDREARPGLDGITEIDGIEGARVGLSVHTDADEVLSRAESAAASHELAEELVPLNPAINDQPQAARYVPPSISPTALDTWRACPRRYYLENVLRAGDLFDIRGTGSRAAEGGALSFMEMGLLVHRVLERDLPSLSSELPAAAHLDLRAAEVIDTGKELAESDHGRALELLENFRRSEVAAMLMKAHAEGSLQRELSFSTLVGQTILQGQIDALCPLPAAAAGSEPAGTLVVDYKTGRVGEERTPEKAADVYKLQMASYALAAARLNPGPVKVVLVYLGDTKPVEVAHEFTVADIADLEAEISSTIGLMGSDDFPPLSGFDKHHCSWCAGGPNGAGLCDRTPEAPRA